MQIILHYYRTEAAITTITAIVKWYFTICYVCLDRKARVDPKISSSHGDMKRKFPQIPGHVRISTLHIPNRNSQVSRNREQHLPKLHWWGLYIQNHGSEGFPERGTLTLHLNLAVPQFQRQLQPEALKQNHIISGWATAISIVNMTRTVYHTLYWSSIIIKYTVVHILKDPHHSISHHVR